jgi:hypothetical protein
MYRKLFYDPTRPSAFSTLQKLQTAVVATRKPKKSSRKPQDVKAWLEKQDAYTLHRHVRKRFPRNPYTVNNMMGVWESDMVDVQSFSKHNDKYRYLLTVIGVFTKYLHVVPLRWKTGTAVASAFQSIFNDSRYTTKQYKRRPVWLRTDKGIVCK